MPGPEFLFLIVLILTGLLYIALILLSKNPEKELMCWAAKGDTARIENFLKKAPFSFYLNARDSKGMTPLMHAAQGGHMDVVKLLLEKGADDKARNRRGETALQLAISEGHTDIAQHLEKVEGVRWS
jgi:ankyrin repeat protein